MFHSLKSVLVMAIMTVAVTLPRAATLTGSVTFSNGLYTYSYEISNAVEPVRQVLILVNSLGYDDTSLPIATTSPDGWTFYLYGGI